MEILRIRALPSLFGDSSQLVLTSANELIAGLHQFREMGTVTISLARVTGDAPVIINDEAHAPPST